MISRLIGTPLISDRTEFSVTTTLEKSDRVFGRHTKRESALPSLGVAPPIWLSAELRHVHLINLHSRRN
jgi:hypothetical protein